MHNEERRGTGLSWIACSGPSTRPAGCSPSADVGSLSQGLLVDENTSRWLRSRIVDGRNSCELSVIRIL
jgi:hypothetical protein